MLTGEGSVGKSIFATQIAECIARGENYFTKSKAHKRKPGRRIIYVDFERTRAQFNEIYSARARRYPFSTRFNHAPLNPDMYISKEYEGKLWKLFRDQVGALAANRKQHNIIVIDNVDYLSPTDGRSGIMRTLKTLKYWTQTLDCSILAVVHARSHRGGPRPLSLGDISGSPHALRYADSVFAIGRTPTGPEYRYLKQLRSRSAPPVYDEKNVAVFELKRLANAVFHLRATYELRITNTNSDHHSPISGHDSRITNHGLLSTIRRFLGLNFRARRPNP